MANRIKVRVGENEIELEGDAKFIEAQLAKFYEKIGATLAKSASAPTPESGLVQSKVKWATPTRDLSPAEFLRRALPKGGTEQLLALGHFLEQNRAAKDFDQKEIKALCQEAKLRDIHGQYFTLAVKQGLLRVSTKGRYALTLTGEDAVTRMLGRGQDE